MQFCSVSPIDRVLSGATIPSQSGPGCNDNEGVLHILKSSSITGASPSDCLVSYLGHSLRRSYASAEEQSVYSTALADWAKVGMNSSHTITFTFGLIQLRKV